MNKDWLDISVLEDYLDGKLDAKAMNRVEREALEDPFVAEALAGLSESPKRALQSISLLQKQLHERIAEHQHVKKASVFTWQRLSIAATAAVMFIAVSIMFWMRENNQQKELAGRPKKVDVMIAPTAPTEERPVVQAVPVIAGKSEDQKREKEIDKLVKAAKTNTYAARAKKKTEVEIHQGPQQLNEVVVVGYAAQQKRAVTGAVASIEKKEMAYGDSINVNNALAGTSGRIRIRGSSTLLNKVEMVSNPVGGWAKLWDYIALDNAFKAEKKTGQIVELDFKIAKDGTPTDIKILKGADKEYEQEAIRLIINGPKWEVPEKLNSRMTFKIDF